MFERLTNENDLSKDYGKRSTHDVKTVFFQLGFLDCHCQAKLK